MRIYLIGLIAIMIAGCTTYQKCVDKFGTDVISDTVLTKDTVTMVNLIPVDYDSVRINIMIDTLQYYDTIEVESDRAIGRIINHQDYVTFQSECKADTIKQIDTLIITKEIITEQKQHFEEKKDNLLLIIILSVVSVVLFLIVILKK